MTDGPAARALSDAHEYLTELSREAVPTREALIRLGALRERHPDVLIDLVWEEQVYPGTIHYDVLLRAPGGDTISLSLSPASDTPWPLRGVRLASDHDLVRVNGETLKVGTAMDCIDFIWNEARVVKSLIDLCIVEEAVKRWSIVRLPAHTQRALDAFRTAHGLVSAAQTIAWMEENELTHERLEHMVRGQAEAFALRDRIVTDAEIDAHWNAHAPAFDVAHIARLRVRSREHANALLAEVRGGRDFYSVMETLLVARKLVALPSGAHAVVRRGELSPEHADAIFNTEPGDIVGPLDADAGVDLVRVIRTDRADRDDRATREAVSDVIFEAWVSDQRRAANIEWFWGPTY